jgi:hypothetical protein
MKQQSKWSAAALVLVWGLVASSSAPAQTIGLSGVDASTTTGYAGWLTANFASGPSVGSAGTAGIEVQASSAGGYGYTYFDLGSGATTINPNSTQVTLTFTVNGTASAYNWLGVPLTLNDGTGTGTYGGIYSGSGNPGNQAGAVWNGNTASLTWALNPAEITAIQGGSDVVYGFNTGVDPAGVPANYDITFNSLTFSPATVVPEPATMSLFGLSAAGLLALRRRK